MCWIAVAESRRPSSAEMEWQARLNADGAGSRGVSGARCVSSDRWTRPKSSGWLRPCRCPISSIFAWPRLAAES